MSTPVHPTDSFLLGDKKTEWKQGNSGVVVEATLVTLAQMSHSPHLKQ